MFPNQYHALLSRHLTVGLYFYKCCGHYHFTDHCTTSVTSVNEAIITADLWMSLWPSYTIDISLYCPHPCICSRYQFSLPNRHWHLLKIDCSSWLKYPQWIVKYTNISHCSKICRTFFVTLLEAMVMCQCKKWRSGRNIVPWEHLLYICFLQCLLPITVYRQTKSALQSTLRNLPKYFSNKTVGVML